MPVRQDDAEGLRALLRRRALALRSSDPDDLRRDEAQQALTHPVNAGYGYAWYRLAYVVANNDAALLLHGSGTGLAKYFVTAALN
jgi:hypothetical protein